MFTTSRYILALFALSACHLIASAALAETVTYPVPDSTLQSFGTWPNSVAPSGGTKSNSLSGNVVTVNGNGANNAFGAVNGVDAAAVANNQVIINSTSALPGSTSSRAGKKPPLTAMP